MNDAIVWEIKATWPLILSWLQNVIQNALTYINNGADHTVYMFKQ